MYFKGFTLDPFQENAVQALMDGHSVVVSAATGTGKTLIADIMIDHSIQKGQKVFYTAPIKALSNQKFNDFCAAYGAHNVGLMTGDVVINPNALVVVMTTEIYRNMLLEGSSTLQGLKFVVFDEIHFINDIERGTVWEESIIFSPAHIRFICLSATIPNYKQFAGWIQSISGHKVVTVSYMERAVPLEHYVYEHVAGLTTVDEMIKKAEHDSQYEDYYKVTHKRRGKDRQQRQKLKVASHMDLVKDLKEREWLPAIFFVFSRKATLEKAQELSRKVDFAAPEEKKYIVEYIRQHITPEIAHMPSVQALRDILPRGIGVHNAGLLPAMKNIVEHLFNKGMLKVLYATETFAVGINMPAKTVCFAALEKYDGIAFRYLNTKEYFQLAGRAGRRGIDPVGRSIVLIDMNSADLHKIKSTTEKDTDPIVSQFRLSYNTVLNLIRKYDPKTTEKILKSNFGYYVKRQSSQQARITTSFTNYRRTLERLGHIKAGYLTQKGIFASNIYTEELAMAELVFDGYLDSLEPKEIVLVIASIIYEGRRADQFDSKGVNINRLLNELSKNSVLAKKIKRIELKILYNIMTAWATTADFEEIIDMCNLPEGDLIRLFRQIIDVLRQIKSGLIAADCDQHLIDKITHCITLIDRDIVAVTF